MKNKIFSAAVFTSFAWNLCLVGGVIFDASYALDRAAGGQFEVFPPYIRLLYVLTFAFIIYQIVIFRRSLYGRAIKPEWIIKAFVVIGVLGILANAASPSAKERWNLIPALIITIAFYRMLKHNLKK